MNTEDRLPLLNRAFSPSAPITSKDLFSGRQEQIEKCCDAINETGQHFVVYGDRGVGKTSLANIIDSCLTNVVVAKVTCNRSDNFKQVWEKSLGKIRFSKEHEGMGFRPEMREEVSQLDLFLPDGDNVSSLDIQHTLEGVGCNLLFLFDEFDSICSRDLQAQFSDTIKALSDNAPRVTIGLIGIADDVDSLIGKHKSLERCLRQIEMPRMSRHELDDIVQKGLHVLQMEACDPVRDRIVELSSGFPHFTHLLGKFAAKRAIEDDRTLVVQKHLDAAIRDAIANANQSIKSSYRKATIATKTKSKFEHAVKACALASVDESGTFAAKDLIEPYYRVSGDRLSASDLAYTLLKLCEKDRGYVLDKLEILSGARYRFASPLMKTYVKLLIDQKGSFMNPSLLP